MHILDIGMVSHRMNLDEFMGRTRPNPLLQVFDSNVLHVDVSALDLTNTQSVCDATEGLLDIDNDYEVAVFKNGRGCALCHERDVIGIYQYGILLVLPDHRGKNLGAFLVLAQATLLGGRIRPVEFTPSGHAAHVTAHRLAVHMALVAGEDVPTSVLRDYPLLQPGPWQKEVERYPGQSGIGR